MPTNRRSRHGFTLVEMLVTITILLIVMGITLSAVNLSMTTDRVPSTARTIQSYLLGARDRAIFAGEPRGVRFIPDTDSSGTPTSPPTVRSMVYIGPIENSTGLLTIGTDGTTLTQQTGANWQTLQNRGLLPAAGARIRIDNGPVSDPSQPVNPPVNGLWYTLASNASGGWMLTEPHVDLTGPGGMDIPYELELAAGILPNQEPMAFPSGVVIDLAPASSKLPATWTTYPNRMDILFSPRGTVTGPVAAAGVIHLLIADIVDVRVNFKIGDPRKEGDETIATIFTRTGQVTLNPVDPTDADTNNIPDDPYRYAETGQVAP